MPTGEVASQAGQGRAAPPPPTDQDRGPGSVAGNLTKDADLRYTPNGKAVASLRIAQADRVRDDRTGNWADGPTTYYDITVWGTLAENVCEVLQKGDRIVAEGRWTANRWTDNDGVLQERIVLTASDLGPSMKYRCARPVRADRSKAES